LQKKEMDTLRGFHEDRGAVTGNSTEYRLC
jgi:hypothetical protein